VPRRSKDLCHADIFVRQGKSECHCVIFFFQQTSMAACADDGAKPMSMTTRVESHEFPFTSDSLTFTVAQPHEHHARRFWKFQHVKQAVVKASKRAAAGGATARRVCRGYHPTPAVKTPGPASSRGATAESPLKKNIGRKKQSVCPLAQVINQSPRGRSAARV